MPCRALSQAGVCKGYRIKGALPGDHSQFRDWKGNRSTSCPRLARKLSITSYGGRGRGPTDLLHVGGDVLCVMRPYGSDTTSLRRRASHRMRHDLPPPR